eukprot:Hpha_TRINITY_DN8088_c0_g1::TRINITY_DN8088_c0_g1_i1::g.140143::m.140143
MDDRQTQALNWGRQNREDIADVLDAHRSSSSPRQKLIQSGAARRLGVKSFSVGAGPSAALGFGGGVSLSSNLSLTGKPSVLALDYWYSMGSDVGLSFDIEVAFNFEDTDEVEGTWGAVFLCGACLEL